MNIFKFHLQLEAKCNMSSISKEVGNAYASKLQDTKDYMVYVKETWDSIGKENIVTLYPSSALIACGQKTRCTYFFVNTALRNEVDQITVEVLVISELEDISDAYNAVYKDIRKKLKGKFKIRLTENRALLYVYDGNDIITSDVAVKANIVTFAGVRKVEIARGAILGILAVIFIIIAVFFQSFAMLCSVMYSLAAACIFFIISEFLIRICRTQKIEINDLTNWIQTEENTKKTYSQNIDLRNPQFEQEE